MAQVVINLAGGAAGLASVSLDTAKNPTASTFSLGAGARFVSSGIVASLIGGLIAGRLSGRPLRGIAGRHGRVSWVVSTLVVFSLLTSAASGVVGSAVSTVVSELGGTGNLVGGTVQTAAQAVQGALYASIALILGAFAAFLGGCLTAPKPLTVRV